MKQNLLFNQLTAMPKRLAMVLTVLFTVGVGSMLGQATLPVDFSFANGKSSLPTGVSQSGLGTDYAASNAPYRLKFDTNGDYIQVEVDGAADKITIGVKQYATTAPQILIQGSVDGSNYTDIETISISVGQNNTAERSSTQSISSTYRYFRIKRSSGGNFGLGTLTISKAAASDPHIVTLVPGSGSVSSTTLTEASAGAGVTLPTPTLDCGDWDFAGWAEESVNAETTTKPTLIPAGAYNPASNITLYAVYQRTETTNGGGNSVSESITIEPNTFPDKGTSSYASGAERTGAVNEISLGGHYITGNQNNTPTGSKAGTYLQCQAKNATIYNKTKLPGNITKVVINQYDAKAFSLYCGSEQLMASNNTLTEQTPSGTKINDVTAATKMTWDVSGDYTYFALKKGSSTSYVTSIVVTYTTFGGSSTTTYYHSTPECAAPCTDPGLAYAIASVTKTVGDAAFTNPLTNNKNVSVTYTSTKTDVATVDNNGQVKIKAVGETTIKATWAGNADYCADEASYTLTVLPKTYTITVANNISNGSVSADKSSAVEGATIKLTATPNTGYKLGTWNVKDASNNPVSVNENGEFTMPASNVTVSATFVSLPKLATPSELSATEINPTSATLNWKWLENTYAAQLSSYYLYIKKEGDADFPGPITYTNTSCSRTNLEPNTTYIWKVQAISKDKTIVLTSEESTPSSFTTAALPTYTVSFSTGTGNPTQADITETEGGQGITLPAGPDPLCPDWTFAGWATSSVDKTTTKPTLLKANDKYQPTSSITLYAVYSQTETTLGEGEELSQTLKYDSWSYTGSTTDKGDYRMFHTGSYVESAPFDLSILTKVVVYGGTFGGDKYNSLTIGDGANVWKTVAVTGNSQTGVNSFTNGNALSGHGKLRITSNSGTASTNGVRISKIDIYTISSITTTTYNSNPDCTPPAKYTITWWANGEEYYTQTAVEGTAIDVPTNSPNAATYACDDKVFVGWVDTEIIGSTDTKPSLITEFGNITEDKNFFAVFASESSTDYPTAYTAGDVGDFVLAAKNGDKWYALPTNPTVNSGKIQGKEIPVTTTNGVEHVTTANALGYTWTIANATNGQTISDGSKYIYHSNGGVDDTKLTYGIGTSFTWKIEKEDAGLTFKAMNGATVNNRGMLVQGTQYGGYSLNNETTNGYYRISVLPIADAVSYSGYVTTCEATTEALSGTFSVGKYEVAQFATGNLQYKPSTDTWRFAKQQYQYVGKDNIYVGKEDYKGWIDLFGWSADDKFGVNPSNDNTNYQGEFVDWGKLFPEEGWSTLSKNQWNYLLNQRTNAASLKQIAMVGETLGIMLFPDEWTLPAGCAPTQQTHHDEEDGEDHSCDFVSYNYTLAHWTELEKAGAIFLPAAGRRTGGWGNKTISPHMIDKAELDADGHYKHYADYYAYYWTSTKTDGKVNYLINCTLVDKVKDTYTVHAGHVNWAEEARYGQSVRLAKVTSTHIEIGGGDNSTVIAANVGEKVNVKVNRTFKANDGYYTICLPFNIDADEIGKAYQINTITEHVAGEGINVEFNEVNALTAGQPYLLLPSKDLENPIFEGVTIVNTTGETTDPVVGAGIKITFTGIINGVGETTGSTDYYVGDKGYLYNGTTEKLGLRAFFTITDEAGNPTKVRARVVVGENTTTDLDNILNGENTTIKVIKNGQLIIIRNGEKFNAQGQKL